MNSVVSRIGGEMKYKIAIIGFGTVGQGFAEILDEKKEGLKENDNWGQVSG